MGTDPTRPTPPPAPALPPPEALAPVAAPSATLVVSGGWQIKRAYFSQPYEPYGLLTGMTFAVVAEEMKLEHVVSMSQWFASNTHPSLTTREHWLTDRIVMMSPTVKYTIINPSWAFPFVYFLSLERFS